MRRVLVITTWMQGWEWRVIPGIIQDMKGNAPGQILFELHFNSECVRLRARESLSDPWAVDPDTHRSCGIPRPRTVARLAHADDKVLANA